MEERIYTEAFITKSLDIEGSWEEDEFGNPIIIIEASNDELDSDDERVLQSALMNSKRYFIQNGVVSYDHKHLPNPDNYKFDPEWNEEKYIMGRPIDAWMENGIVKVKAVLSRSNARAKEIISKLKDNLGTVKASVGGRRVKAKQMWNPKTKRQHKTIFAVDWDEVALTYKPVNQTLGPTILSPKQFVKSLTAGSSANPGDMGTGGNTLQSQGVERDTIRALFVGLRDKKIRNSEEAINHLVNNGGIEKSRAEKILKMIVNNKLLGDVVMDGKDTKDVDNNVDNVDAATDELQKALNDLEDDTLQKAKKRADGMYKCKNGYEYMKKGKKWVSEDKDAPELDDDDENGMGKSIGDDDFDLEFDATEDIAQIRKSMGDIKEENSGLTQMVKSLTETVEKQQNLLKAIAQVTQNDSAMIKSMHDAPMARQSVQKNLNIDERFSKSVQENMTKVTQGSLLKSMQDNEVDPALQSNVNVIFRRQGMAGVAMAYPKIAEMAAKE